MIRVFRHYMLRSLVILGAGEALILFGAVYAAVSASILEINPTSRLLVGPVWTKGIAFVVIMMSVMAAALPADSYRLFAPVTGDIDEFRREQRDWIAEHGAGFAVVHADPRNPLLPDIVQRIAGETGFLVGGLSSSRGAIGQLAGSVAEGCVLTLK